MSKIDVVQPKKKIDVKWIRLNFDATIRDDFDLIGFVGGDHFAKVIGAKTHKLPLWDAIWKRKQHSWLLEGCYQYFA